MSLREQYEAMGLPELAGIPLRETKEVFARHLEEVRRQFPNAPKEWQAEHAAARAHCLRHQQDVRLARAAAGNPAVPVKTLPSLEARRLWAWRIAILAALLFLCFRVGHAQNCGICVVRATGNGITGTHAFAAPFTITLGANLSGSLSGSNLTLSASATAATAWSGITPATNANAGTFSLGAGVIFQYGTGTLNANEYKGGAASGTGACAAGTYAVTLNDAAAPSCLAVTAANVGSLPGTSGQLLYNNAGAIGAEDPVVSGHDATGTAPSAPPVYIAGWDGTNIRPILEDTSGHPIVNINGTVPVSGTFWQATQPVSLAALPALTAGSANIGTIGNTAFGANQGTAGALSSAWPVELTDAANVLGTSTHPVRTDPTGATTQPVSVTNFPATQQVSAGAGFPTAPTASASVSDATSGLTQIVAAVSGKAIYVTGYTLIVNASVSAQWEYGTGVNCATGTTALTGAMSFAANSGATAGQGNTLFIPAGDALCLNLGGAVQVSGSVSYAQQ